MWSQALPIPVFLLPFPPAQALVEETGTSCASHCFPFPPHECDVSRGGRVGGFLTAMFHWVSAMGLEGEAAISCGEGWGWGEGCVGAMDDEAGLLKVPS